jgi:predicted NAD/FAD-binding protein
VETLAIIGAGIAGLGCAHELQRHFALTLYEKDARAGGHAHTVQVAEAGGPIPIDTGFMTFNRVTYPHLTRLFGALGVATQPSPMSFSVQHRPRRLEFCGSSLSLLFGQRRNLLRPRFWRLLLTIDCFNREAVAALRSGAPGEQSLAAWLAARGYGEEFRDCYLLPMSCAVWSAPPDRMLEFPATTLLRFFHNHGFLGLHTQHPWFTVSGGSQRYVERLTAPFRDRIHLRRGVVAVRREAGGVSVLDASGHRASFDRVILACHADQSLALLADADAAERDVLGAFGYERNTAVLHTDDAVMPATRRCWSSWNYRIDRHPDGRPSHSTVYWINSLQRPDTRQNYFLSINGEESLRPERILQRIGFEHPQFDRAAIRAQRELPALNRRHTRVYFCGSYFRYGFHEDALGSALELSRLLAPALAGAERSACAPDRSPSPAEPALEEQALAGALP